MSALVLMATLLHATPAVPPELSDSDVAARAETAFQEGVRLREAAGQARPQFRQAAIYFEELRRRGIHNAALYRNLGNAYLLADDLPRAILTYRRGLRLEPNDLSLREMLTAARERVVYPESGALGRPQNDPRPPWLPYPRGEWLMSAAVLAYLLACICLTRWLMVRRGRLLALGTMASLLALGMLGWTAVRAGEERDREIHPLVVIARDGVVLRRGNSKAFPPRFETPLNRGVEARFLFEREGWVQIELSGGEIGWAPRTELMISD